MYHNYVTHGTLLACLPSLYVIGHVIQSAAFFSNISKANEKSLIFIMFLFFIVFLYVTSCFFSHLLSIYEKKNKPESWT